MKNVTNHRHQHTVWKRPLQENQVKHLNTRGELEADRHWRRYVARVASHSRYGL